MSTRQVSATAIVAAAAVLVGQACRDPTEMRVEVTTSIDCSHIRNVTIAVGAVNGLESRPAATQSTSCDANGNIGTLVVVPSQSGAGEVGIRVIAGLDGTSADACLAHGNVGGCVVARRALRFVDHTALTVPVSLDPECRDVPCSPDSTCAKGACVPAATSCSGARCTIDAIGDAGVDATAEGGADAALEAASDAASDAAVDAGASHWLPLPAQSLVTGRASQLAAWTGHEVWLLGGTVLHGGFANDGLRFAPSSGAWTAIAPGPLSASAARPGAWTGSQLVVWGSASDRVASDGARFDGTSWAKMSDPSSFPGLAGFVSRTGHALVWADNVKRIIVWGGFDAQTGATLNDGALYDPSADSWTAMKASPLTPRAVPGAVMIGGKLVLFSGYCGAGCATAAIYDPVADSWSTALNVSAPGRIPALSVTDGSRAFFWGGEAYSQGPEFNDLVIVDPMTLKVDVRVGQNAPSARASTAGWWSGGRLWLWGGSIAVDGGSATAPLGDGASYDVSSDRWTPMPTAGAPSARRSHSMTWTGTQAVLFGGYDPSSDEQATGAIFVP